MKRWLTPGLTLALLIAAPLLLLGAGDAAAGKAVYDKKCATCHGPDGAGKDAIAKMMKVTLRPLGSKEVQAKSDAELSKDITAGNGKMKAVTGLSEADVANVVAYVRTLAKK